MARVSIACIILIVCFVYNGVPVLGGKVFDIDPNVALGVCYGMQGNNLPPPREAMTLLQRCGIKQIMLYDSNPDVLEAIADVIRPPYVLLVTIGVRNEEMAELAGSVDAARAWVAKNVVPYQGRVLIFEIMVGNEVVPGENARYLVPTMSNLIDAIRQANLVNAISVSTSIPLSAVQDSYPPSHATFTPEAVETMKSLVAFQKGLLPGLRGTIYISLYPYYAHAADPEHVPLDYALFEAKTPAFKDGDRTYWNLFDAMYDAFLWAMEKIGGDRLEIDVGETGWPSAGGSNSTTPEIARTYINNFYNHFRKEGTPKLPPKAVISKGYIFALFNENLKPAGVEQNFGLFYPDMKPVYPNPFCY